MHDCNSSPATQIDSRTSSLTVGIDLGDKKSFITVLDAAGTAIEAGEVATTLEALRQRFDRMERCRIAMEVGTHSTWVSELLTELGHEVHVANSRKLASISQSKSKSDRKDSEQLARLARVDPKLLSPIAHRGADTRHDLAVLRARTALVSSRTSLVNHVRCVLKSNGHRAKSCNASDFHRSVAKEVPSPLRPALAPLLEVLTVTSAQIATLDKEVDRLAAEVYPETVLLRQVNRVGRLTSLLFVLTIVDPHRIKDVRNVGAYVGLCPARRQSGDMDLEMRITREGDGELRRCLVQCAQQILGPHGEDCDLRRWGLELAKRGGKKAYRKAIVAVARKLSVLLLTLWRTGEVYEPLRNARLRGEVVPASASLQPSSAEQAEPEGAKPVAKLPNAAAETSAPKQAKRSKPSRAAVPSSDAAEVRATGTRPSLRGGSAPATVVPFGRPTVTPVAERSAHRSVPRPRSEDRPQPTREVAGGRAGDEHDGAQSRPPERPKRSGPLRARP